METSLKTGFAQIFSGCPKNLSCPNFGGAAAPPSPPWPVRLWMHALFSILRLLVKQLKNKPALPFPNEDMPVLFFLVTK